MYDWWVVKFKREWFCYFVDALFLTRRGFLTARCESKDFSYIICHIVQCYYSRIQLISTYKCLFLSEEKILNNMDVDPDSVSLSSMNVSLIIYS